MVRKFTIPTPGTKCAGSNLIEENAMKLHRIAASGALLLAAVISFAQTKEGDLVADIPVGFVAAGRTLPAGHYIINRLNEDLCIHDTQSQSLFVPTHSAQRSAHYSTSKMVFHRYGDTYFLEEVWAGSTSIGRALFPSLAERKLKERGLESEIAAVRFGK
jgi:hypothetical protein